ncbi:MAG TPA: SRPBCC family protein [Solirubrobacteraceae bacterium]|nr:SRPBCC family protein [Solirubrobacteraceae bacterium]
MIGRLVAAGLVAASWPAYARRVRPWVLTWGSTASEATAGLPGDELLARADGVATRAIKINAPASAVWPWIVQMGPAPRGGAYTYDWVENLLRLDMHSVDQVLPRFQHPQVGEVIRYGANRMRLERVERERVLAWRSEDGNWVWTFVLVQIGGVTRLISRNRFRLPTLIARLGMVAMEPASLVMERKMLLGIKQRAERLAASGGSERAWGHFGDQVA